jgi:general secretion pathway protein D
VVRDRDTIAMGGLMRDQKIESESKVPLLGDIPVLGWLFKNKQNSTTKVNMLFFLTPKIMDSYQKTVGSTVKDVLGRRAGHLKEVIGEKDYFAPAVKGLFEKASRQEEGPLFNPADTTRYIKQNEEPATGPTPSTPENNEENSGIEEIQVKEEVQPNESEMNNTVPLGNNDPLLDPPDYASIVQAVKEKKAAPKK